MAGAGRAEPLARAGRGGDQRGPASRYGFPAGVFARRTGNTDELTKRTRRPGLMPALNDSVVLLTGGATGIGRAIALEMAAAGAAVAIGDLNADDGQ